MIVNRSSEVQERALDGPAGRPVRSAPGRATKRPCVITCHPRIERSYPALIRSFAVRVLRRDRHPDVGVMAPQPPILRSRCGALFALRSGSLKVRDYARQGSRTAAWPTGRVQRNAAATLVGSRPPRRDSGGESPRRSLVFRFVLRRQLDGDLDGLAELHRRAVQRRRLDSATPSWRSAPSRRSSAFTDPRHDRGLDGADLVDHHFELAVARDDRPGPGTAAASG